MLCKRNSFRNIYVMFNFKTVYCAKVRAIMRICNLSYEWCRNAKN